MKISSQITKFSMQELDFDCSVFPVAICCGDTTSADTTKEQLLKEKSACAKFQINISETE